MGLLEQDDLTAEKIITKVLWQDKVLGPKTIFTAAISAN